MKESELLAYVAGIIDGEGNISYLRTSASTHFNYEPRVCVTNCSVELMELLQREFGGSVRRKNVAAGRRECYSWELRYYRVGPFLEKVFPYLLIKREQAVAVLAACKLKFSRTYRYDGTGSRIPDNRMALIEGKIYDKMKTLNLWGKEAS